MRYTRIFADAAGQSQFEEVDIGLREADFGSPVEPMDLSAPIEAARLMFATIPVGWVGERHTAPRRQWFLQLTGVIETEVSDGRRVRTGPGSITLIEDTEGSGHVTRVIGDVPVTGGFVHLPD
jgi:hypothetical protein